jgi:hypothetical protein
VMGRGNVALGVVRQRRVRVVGGHLESPLT